MAGRRGEALTPEQRRREERRIKEARAQRAAEERSRREQARVRAGSLWAQARPAEDDHPYLREKQAPALGLRQMKDRLVAPVRDLDGALHSLAFINPEGEKRFLTDGAVEGHCHVLGDLYRAHAMLLCEGYATGASLHQASGWPVVVCFNRANLLPVARAVHRRYPDAALVIAGDDDRYTPGNPGRRDAEEAAEEVGGSVILPDFAGLDTAKKPTDFNDLQVLGGLPRLKASLQRRLADVWPDSARSPETPARPVEPGRRAGRGLDGETTEPEGEHDMDNDLNPMPIPPVLAMAAPARRKAPLGAHSNLYQEVTDRIVEMIESGTAPWRRPWDRPRHPGAPTRPVNAATGKFYNGINVLLLHAHLMTLDDPRWCGYEQAKARGWQVKAGARGASIYFFKRLEIDAARDPDGEPLLDEDGAPLKRSLPLLRRHTVFHASQIEGMPSLEEAYGPVDAWPDHRWDAEDRLEALLHRSGAHLVHEGSIAYYHPREDRIVAAAVRAVSGPGRLLRGRVSRAGALDRSRDPLESAPGHPPGLAGVRARGAAGGAGQRLPRGGTRHPTRPGKPCRLSRRLSGPAAAGPPGNFPGRAGRPGDRGFNPGPASDLAAPAGCLRGAHRSFTGRNADPGGRGAFDP